MAPTLVAAEALIAKETFDLVMLDVVCPTATASVFSSR